MTTAAGVQLEELAKKINDTHERIGIALRRTIKEAAQIGAWLLEAKRKVPHGQWQSWADQHLQVKERERRYYMQIAKNPEQAKKVKTIHDFARLHLETNKDAGEEERKAFIAEAVAKLLHAHDNWQVHQADNRIFDWKPMDHIWTDPPWPFTSKELDHYTWLASMAWKQLKDGGLVAVQCGQMDLAKVLPLFKQFHYITTLAIVYSQACNKAAHCFLPNWKPVLLFSKGEARLQGRVTDTFTVCNSRRIKVYHPWQQPLEPFVKWIPALTQPGDVIADPFACTGTIALACKMTGRRFVGTEVNPDMIAVARKRLAECGAGQGAQARRQGEERRTGRGPATVKRQVPLSSVTTKGDENEAL